MKNTFKLLSVGALAFVSLQGVAQDRESVLLGSSDTVRLVINAGSTSTATQSATSESFSESCVATPDGANDWCLSSEKAQRLNQLRSAVSNNGGGFEVVKLPSYGYSSARVAEILNQSGKFGLVEVDAVTRTRPGIVGYVSSSTATSQSVNDPAFSQYQLDYFQSADDSPSGSNILGFWDAIGMDAVTQVKNPVDLIVMDSSFVENSESPYTAGGRNFSTTALEKDGPAQERSDNFQPPAELDGMNCGSHGLEVSSIATALIDNGKNISGVTNNVNVHAIRTLTCGTGFLSDAADAMDWLTGKSFDNVTPYSGNVGVVNMSFAAQTMECPTFLQDAINRATEAGFTFVAAAGNESGNAVEHSPANCDNVISTGSLARDGEKADFTNSDESIDIMAQGKRIAVVCGDSEHACYGEGTSYSAPLVSSVLATVKQLTLADDELLKFALKTTARTDTLGPSCGDGSCGSGLMEALGVYTIAQQAQEGELNRIEHALAGKDECEQEWYMDHFGSEGRLCEMYKVTFMGGFHTEGVQYQLVSISKGSNWETATPSIEGQFDQPIVTLESIDAESFDYGMQTCEDGVCDEVRAMNIEKALPDTRPAVCAE
ncbi:S8 family peptidase [Idiomarina aminovorans]|uniref:S8 family peptidase n=1 Tax=Idiomarina aminovorans TaxID=2914829 RepID=UPI00200564F4|nr:S8 family serine peptidase [Idiomarina sp. ATCH4]MCK7460196.1 S8 family serine peptidase [Idiomarina sp. ATCH4]